MATGGEQSEQSATFSGTRSSNFSDWPLDPPANAQPSVYSKAKYSALFLWVYVKATANVHEVARRAARLQDIVAIVGGEDVATEVVAGVGFGQSFYENMGRVTSISYNYQSRTGEHGNMPSSGGDIFVHAKCHTPGPLYDLCRRFLASLPPACVESFEDIYGFTYRDGRDLSGFIYGTENPLSTGHRQNVTVEAATGGSYALTQKWIHDMQVIYGKEDYVLENWIGRSRDARSTELAEKNDTSHVSRMTGGVPFAPKKYDIYRQSLPFGNFSTGVGLFFLAYASSPIGFDWMLDRMMGMAEDKLCDDVMRFSKNVKGNYWYFPGVVELCTIGNLLA